MAPQRLFRVIKLFLRGHKCGAINKWTLVVTNYLVTYVVFTMPITRSRAASLTRRDDTLEVFPDPSRPTTPTPTAPAYHQDGGGASSPRTDNNNATFSADNFATIIASLQRSQTESLSKELFDSVNRANASSPVAVRAKHPYPLQGHLLRPTKRIGRSIY